MPEFLRPEPLPMAEAVAQLAARGAHLVPTERWPELWQEAHRQAFTVAGALRDDLLRDLYTAVEKGITEGTTLEQFRKDFDEIIARTGWDYTGGRNWRTATIFNTNMRVSYASGRYQQATDPAVLAARPYWIYDAVNDNRTRPEHAAWDTLVLPADDPWWHTHYPPNGWGCRCLVRSAGPRELAQLGLSVGAAPQDGTYEWTDPATGEVHTIPKGIDPGWAYNPGATGPLPRSLV